VAGYLLTAVAGLAVLLAALGLYGVVSGLVGERTQEIGLRVALGAQRRDVAAWVLGKSLSLVSLGTVLGIAGSLALGRVLESLLFEVRSNDPATLAAVALLLVLVAVVATALPMRRATRVDPIMALRAE